jgi:hypothetical protein
MAPIDFKAPVNRLSEVFYDIELQPVYFGYIIPDNHVPRLMENKHYRAVVNLNSGKMVSVVSKNYRLITNREALEMGKEIFVQLLPGLKKSELIPYKVVAPKSLSSVHIDLIHQDVNFNIWEQETWLPFLRISNSYNRSQALAFEVGFVKKLCSNGVLFNKKTMKLKYIHDRDHQIRLKSDAGEIFSFSRQFGEQCERLRSVPIPFDDMFPLLCMALKINLRIPTEKQIQNRAEQLKKFRFLVLEQTRCYEEPLGLNAYTAFNIATDLVSHNDRYQVFPGYSFNIRSFFTRPAGWMEDFIAKTRNPEFKLQEYLSPAVDGLNEWGKITGFQWN